MKEVINRSKIRAPADVSHSDDNTWNYDPVPPASLRLFRMMWQLETWLRTLVYVELRAARVDWEEPIKNKIHEWPPNSLKNDKRLHHMSTYHQAALSYLTFAQLWDVISLQDNWPMFAPYFPPLDNTKVRVEEVKAIRNRVAHFRDSHPKDEKRLELFMGDMEGGLRKFCDRYLVGKIATVPDHDPITEHLASSWSQFGYGIEMENPNGGWLYAPPPHTHNPLINARLQLLTHSNYKRGSLVGVIYKVTVSASIKNSVDAATFIESTKALHKDIIHIFLSPLGHDISVTIPAAHGIASTSELIGAFLSAGLSSARSHSVRKLDRARLKWPEYILWPDHMLTFYDADMREPILDLS